MATPLGNLQAASMQRFNANMQQQQQQGQQGGYGGGGYGGGGPAPGSSPFLDNQGGQPAVNPGFAPQQLFGGGPTTPGQLASLMPQNPNENQQMMGAARQMQFNELERMPQMFQGEMGQQISGQLMGQMMGEDAPFTPEVQNLMRGQSSDQISGANRMRQRMIGDQGAANGLGGGGAQMGARLQSQEQAAQQRAQANTTMGLGFQQGNYDARQQGLGMGMDWMGQQATALGQAAMGKANALGRFNVTGDSILGGGGGGGGATGVPSGFINTGFDGSGGSVGYGSGMGPQFKTDKGGYMEGGGNGQSGMQRSWDPQQQQQQQDNSVEAQRAKWMAAMNQSGATSPHPEAQPYDSSWLNGTFNPNGSTAPSGSMSPVTGYDQSGTPIYGDNYFGRP